MFRARPGTEFSCVFDGDGYPHHPRLAPQHLWKNSLRKKPSIELRTFVSLSKSPAPEPSPLKPSSPSWLDFSTALQKFTIANRKQNIYAQNTRPCTHASIYFLLLRITDVETQQNSRGLVIVAARRKLRTMCSSHLWYNLPLDPIHR